MDTSELKEIQKVARGRRMTVAAWVRQVLRAAREGEPRTPAKQKLQAIRIAAGHAFPVADVDQMIAEIESGYPTDLPR